MRVVNIPTRKETQPFAILYPLRLCQQCPQKCIGNQCQIVVRKVMGYIQQLLPGRAQGIWCDSDKWVITWYFFHQSIIAH